MPEWLEVSVVKASDDLTLGALDEGEKSAISLGLSISADLILIDDRKGAAIARRKGFEVTGTLGILDLAARRGMVGLADTLTRLRTTNFRGRNELFDALLRQHERDGCTLKRSRRRTGSWKLAFLEAQSTTKTQVEEGCHSWSPRGRHPESTGDAVDDQGRVRERGTT
jgi:hypothetical protein